MRKSLFIIPMLLLFAFLGAPSARADMYTPVFTCAGTCVSQPSALAVSFPSVPLPITETWNSYTYTISFAQNPTIFDAPQDQYTWSNFLQPCGFGCVNALAYLIQDLTTGDTAASGIISVPNPPTGIYGTDNGTLQFIPVAPPNPSS